MWNYASLCIAAMCAATSLAALADGYSFSIAQGTNARPTTTAEAFARIPAVTSSAAAGVARELGLAARTGSGLSQGAVVPSTTVADAAKALRLGQPLERSLWGWQMRTFREVDAQVPFNNGLRQPGDPPHPVTLASGSLGALATFTASYENEFGLFFSLAAAAGSVVAAAGVPHIIFRGMDLSSRVMQIKRITHRLNEASPYTAQMARLSGGTPERWLDLRRLLHMATLEEQSNAVIRYEVAFRRVDEAIDDLPQRKTRRQQEFLLGVELYDTKMRRQASRLEESAKQDINARLDEQAQAILELAVEDSGGLEKFFAEQKLDDNPELRNGIAKVLGLEGSFR